MKGKNSLMEKEIIIEKIFLNIEEGSNLAHLSF